jgi:hypothetical protein
MLYLTADTGTPLLADRLSRLLILNNKLCNYKNIVLNVVGSIFFETCI